MSPEALAQVYTILTTPVASLPIRYLGFPLTEGRMRNADWQPVMAKIKARLEGLESTTPFLWRAPGATPVCLDGYPHILRGSCSYA